MARRQTYHLNEGHLGSKHPGGGPVGITGQVHGVLPSDEPSLYCLVNIAISWTEKVLQPIEKELNVLRY